MAKRMCIAVILVAALGCTDGDTPRPTPTAPTPPGVPPPGSPPSSPVTMRILQGTVIDGVFPVPNARVEIVGGPGTGMAAVSGTNGQYSLTVARDAGELELRASRDGFQSDARRIDVSSNFGRLDFTLEPVSFGNVAGEWWLTIEASPTCGTLPAVARTRRYRAVIEQAGASATARLRSGDFLFPPELRGTVYASTVRFQLACLWLECIIERTESGDLGIFGDAELPLGASPLSGALTGTMGIYPAGRSSPVGPFCTSTDHRFTLER